MDEDYLKKVAKLIDDEINRLSKQEKVSTGDSKKLLSSALNSLKKVQADFKSNPIAAAAFFSNPKNITQPLRKLQSAFGKLAVAEEMKSKKIEQQLNQANKEAELAAKNINILKEAAKKDPNKKVRKEAIEQLKRMGEFIEEEVEVTKKYEKTEAEETKKVTEETKKVTEETKKRTQVKNQISKSKSTNKTETAKKPAKQRSASALKGLITKAQKSLDKLSDSKEIKLVEKNIKQLQKELNLLSKQSEAETKKAIQRDKKQTTEVIKQAKEEIKKQYDYSKISNNPSLKFNKTQQTKTNFRAEARRVNQRKPKSFNIVPITNNVIDKTKPKKLSNYNLSSSLSINAKNSNVNPLAFKFKKQDVLYNTIKRGIALNTPNTSGFGASSNRLNRNIDPFLEATLNKRLYSSTPTSLGKDDFLRVLLNDKSNYSNNPSLKFSEPSSPNISFRAEQRRLQNKPRTTLPGFIPVSSNVIDKSLSKRIPSILSNNLSTSFGVTPLSGAIKSVGNQQQFKIKKEDTLYNNLKRLREEKKAQQELDDKLISSIKSPRITISSVDKAIRRKNEKLSKKESNNLPIVPISDNVSISAIDRSILKNREKRVKEAFNRTRGISNDLPIVPIRDEDPFKAVDKSIRRNEQKRIKEAVNRQNNKFFDIPDFVPITGPDPLTPIDKSIRRNREKRVRQELNRQNNKFFDNYSVPVSDSVFEVEDTKAVSKSILRNRNKFKNKFNVDPFSNIASHPNRVKDYSIFRPGLNADFFERARVNRNNYFDTATDQYKKMYGSVLSTAKDPESKQRILTDRYAIAAENLSRSYLNKRTDPEISAQLGQNQKKLDAARIAYNSVKSTDPELAGRFKSLILSLQGEKKQLEENAKAWAGYGRTIKQVYRDTNGRFASRDITPGVGGNPPIGGGGGRPPGTTTTLKNGAERDYRVLGHNRAHNTTAGGLINSFVGDIFLVSQIGYMFKDVGNIMVDTFTKANAELEVYLTTLKSTLGTTEKAENVFYNFAQAFALQVPFFETQDLVASVNKLSAEGFTPYQLTGNLDPSKGQKFQGSLVKSITDLASAFGKDPDQATDAFISAIQNRFVRLRQFGISRDDLKNFGFTGNAGDKQGAVSALRNVIELRYGGITETLGKTFKGATSNVSDFVNTMARVATEKSFKRITGVFTEIAEGISLFEEGFTKVKSGDFKSAASANLINFLQNDLGNALDKIVSSFVGFLKFLEKYNAQILSLGVLTAAPFVAEKGKDLFSAIFGSKGNRGQGAFSNLASKTFARPFYDLGVIAKTNSLFKTAGSFFGSNVQLNPKTTGYTAGAGVTRYNPLDPRFDIFGRNIFKYAETNAIKGNVSNNFADFLANYLKNQRIQRTIGVTGSSLGSGINPRIATPAGGTKSRVLNFSFGNSGLGIKNAFNAATINAIADAEKGLSKISGTVASLQKGTRTLALFGAELKRIFTIGAGVFKFTLFNSVFEILGALNDLRKGIKDTGRVTEFKEFVSNLQEQEKLIYKVFANIANGFGIAFEGGSKGGLFLAITNQFLDMITILLKGAEKVTYVGATIAGAFNNINKTILGAGNFLTTGLKSLIAVPQLAGAALSGGDITSRNLHKNFIGGGFKPAEQSPVRDYLLGLGTLGAVGAAGTVAATAAGVPLALTIGTATIAIASAALAFSAARQKAPTTLDRIQRAQAFTGSFLGPKGDTVTQGVQNIKTGIGATARLGNVAVQSLFPSLLGRALAAAGASSAAGATAAGPVGGIISGIVGLVDFATSLGDDIRKQNLSKQSYENGNEALGFYQSLGSTNFVSRSLLPTILGTLGSVGGTVLGSFGLGVGALPGSIVGATAGAGAGALLNNALGIGKGIDEERLRRSLQGINPETQDKAIAAFKKADVYEKSVNNSTNIELAKSFEPYRDELLKRQKELEDLGIQRTNREEKELKILKLKTKEIDNQIKGLLGLASIDEGGVVDSAITSKQESDQKIIDKAADQVKTIEDDIKFDASKLDKLNTEIRTATFSGKDPKTVTEKKDKEIENQIINEIGRINKLAKAQVTVDGILFNEKEAIRELQQKLLKVKEETEKDFTIGDSARRLGLNLLNPNQKQTLDTQISKFLTSSSSDEKLAASEEIKNVLSRAGFSNSRIDTVLSELTKTVSAENGITSLQNQIDVKKRFVDKNQEQSRNINQLILFESTNVEDKVQANINRIQTGISQGSLTIGEGLQVSLKNRDWLLSVNQLKDTPETKEYIKFVKDLQKRYREAFRGRGEEADEMNEALRDSFALIDNLTKVAREFDTASLDQTFKKVNEQVNYYNDLLSKAVPETDQYKEITDQLLNSLKSLDTAYDSLLKKRREDLDLLKNLNNATDDAARISTNINEINNLINQIPDVKTDADKNQADLIFARINATKQEQELEAKNIEFLRIKEKALEKLNAIEEDTNKKIQFRNELSRKYGVAELTNTTNLGDNANRESALELIELYNSINSFRESNAETINNLVQKENDLKQKGLDLDRQKADAIKKQAEAERSRIALTTEAYRAEVRAKTGREVDPLTEQALVVRAVKADMRQINTLYRNPEITNESIKEIQTNLLNNIFKLKQGSQTAQTQKAIEVGLQYSDTLNNALKSRKNPVLPETLAVERYATEIGINKTELDSVRNSLKIARSGEKEASTILDKINKEITPEQLTKLQSLIDKESSVSLSNLTPDQLINKAADTFAKAVDVFAGKVNTDLYKGNKEVLGDRYNTAKSANTTLFTNKTTNFAGVEVPKAQSTLLPPKELKAEFKIDPEILLNPSGRILDKISEITAKYSSPSEKKTSGTEKSYWDQQFAFFSELIKVVKDKLVQNKVDLSPLSNRLDTLIEAVQSLQYNDNEPDTDEQEPFVVPPKINNFKGVYS